MPGITTNLTKNTVTWADRWRAWWRKHLKPIWQDFEWPAVWALGILAVFLGYRGFAKFYAAGGEPRSPFDLLYVTLQLFMLESGAVAEKIHQQLPRELELARLLAPFVAAYTATKALMIVFSAQLQRLRMRLMSNHVVICGLGRIGSKLAQIFHELGYQVVAIEKDPARLERYRQRRRRALIGDATNIDVLRQARVDRAKYFVSVCGRDGDNAEVLVNARELVRDRKHVLTGLVHILDLKLCALLREQEIVTKQFDAFRLEFFNIFENGARAILTTYPAFEETGPAPSPPVHLLIVGLGRLGESLAVRAVRNWRALHPAAEARLDLTIVDKAAKQKTESLLLRYPQIPKICAIHPVEIDIYSPEFQRAEFLLAAGNAREVTTAYICFDDDLCGLHAALTLLERSRERPIPIIVRMQQEEGLAILLRSRDAENRGFKNLHPFGFLDLVCKTDLLLGGTYEILARTIHEDYVRKQEKAGQTPQTNPSMAPWEKLSENLKESNRRQADHIGVKLRAVGCSIAPLTDWDGESFTFSVEEVEKLARLEHDRWCAERSREGWRYAPGPKNLEQKTSPYLVSWEQLSEEIRDLDRNTVRGLPAFLGGAGFQIYHQKKD